MIVVRRFKYTYFFYSLQDKQDKLWSNVIEITSIDLVSSSV